MDDRKDDNVKLLNDANPNHVEETRTEQPLSEMNRHERRKALALARRKIRGSHDSAAVIGEQRSDK